MISRRHLRIVSGACPWAVCIFAAAVFGCSAEQRTGPTMSDSAFVEVMVELLNMKNPPNTDTTFYAYSRRQILERHKVTAEELERVGELLAEDPEHLSDIWVKIRGRIEKSGR